MTDLTNVAQGTANPRALGPPSPNVNAKPSGWAPERGTSHLPLLYEMIFCGLVTNFLEISLPGFHYSVIGEYATVSMACERLDSFPLNDGAQGSNSRLGTSRAPQPPSAARWATNRLPGSRARENDERRFNFTGFGEFRTGKGKINAKYYSFSYHNELIIHGAGASMRQWGKNISATHPLPAAAAPISRGPMGVISAGCGVTLNSGAADASGG